MRSVWMIRFGSFLVAILATACSSAEDTRRCPASCPAAFAGIALVVTAATDGGDEDAGAPNAVQATLTGPATETMLCVPRGTATPCTWPAGDVIAGSYMLEVAAPGFRSVSVSAMVALVSSECGCQFWMIRPSAISLDPL